MSRVESEIFLIAIEFIKKQIEPFHVHTLMFGLLKKMVLIMQSNHERKQTFKVQ